MGSLFSFVIIIIGAIIVEFCTRGNIVAKVESFCFFFLLICGFCALGSFERVLFVKLVGYGHGSACFFFKLDNDHPKSRVAVY